MAISNNVVIAVVFLVMLFVVVPLAYLGCGQLMVWVVLDAVTAALNAAASNTAGEADAGKDDKKEDAAV